MIGHDPNRQPVLLDDATRLRHLHCVGVTGSGKTTALLNTYSSEKDVDDTRARALKENEAAILDAEKKIAGAMKRQKELDGEKEFYAKKTLPAKLQQDIRANELDLKNQQDLLDAKKKQVASINAKYDEDKKRYVELTKNLPKR